jgi:hypothetical protein
MTQRHEVLPAEANEVLADHWRVTLDPDPSSVSGDSVRIIGVTRARRLLTVITLVSGGTRWGVNGWDANPADVRRYRFWRDY